MREETPNKKGNLEFYKELAKQALVLFGVILVTQAVYANPVGGEVAAGAATIEQTATTTQVNQSSDKAIINWQSFNIAPGESTHFNVPNSSSVTLNRVVGGGGASQIFGQLTSNGRIVLINQAGVYFSPTAYVNVSGLIASTRDISDENFLAGKFTFDGPSTLHGTVINQGTIIAANNGLVALIGSNVSNEGLIQANAGNVVLASGNKFTIDLTGDGLINFAVTQESDASHVATVSNSGTIIANGGKILLTAKNAASVVDNVINMSGVVQAQSVSQKNGEIIFEASGGGAVKVAGTVDVSGNQAGLTGGTAKVLGRNIVLDSSAVIDASGYSGGGNIIVGGNFLGAGPEQNALTTYVASGAALNANALINGDGGKIVVWSDLYTGFHGSVSAQGGVLGGDGGFVETSSKGYLNILGMRAYLTALNGINGTLLLDPSAVTITSSATSNENLASGTYTPTADASNILNTDIMSLLNGGTNVIITTSGGSASSGSITVAAPITWATTNTLSLLAQSTSDDTITINSNGLNPMINATGGGNLTLIAGSGTGTITINGGINLKNTTSANGLLTLSAANIANSITTANPTGSTIGGAINVGNFLLSQGQWMQTAASLAALPTFNVNNNFSIAAGSVYPTAAARFNASFFRTVGGDGTSGNPYLVADIYGLQGISTLDLTRSYSLAQSIDASITANWSGSLSGYSGFIPIGYGDYNAVTGFSGNFYGNNYAITNLYINAGTNAAGLFGSTFGAFATHASVSNLTVTGANVTGGNNSGVLIGMGGLTDLSNIYVNGTLQGTATSNSMGILVGWFDTGNVTNVVTGGSVNNPAAQGNAGGLIGNGGGTISNAYSTASVTGNGVGNAGVGGLIGRLVIGSVDNSYSSGEVSGTGNLGGLVGAGGGVNNSFWDMDSSNQSSSVGGTGITTADAMTLTTFTNAGWSITSTPTSSGSPNFTWFMFENGTRPMLLSELFPTTSTTQTIYTPHQLQLMGAALNESYTLGQNINLAATNTIAANNAEVWGGALNANTTKGFISIGEMGAPFTGSLDGQNYTISNLYIDTSDSIIGLGMFGVADGVTIQNLILQGAHINAPLAIDFAPLLGLVSSDSSASLIDNVLVIDPEVTGGEIAAGMIGNIGSGNYTATVSNSGVINPNIDVTGTRSAGLIGVISTGASNMLVTNSFSLGGKVTSTHIGSGGNNSFIGGLIGDVGGNISNSYSTTEVEALNGYSVGGFVGRIYQGSITNSYSTGAVTANLGLGEVGGFVGRVEGGTVSYSFSTGLVQGAGATGGFVGSNSGTVGNTNFWDVTTSGIGSDGSTANGCGGGSCLATGQSTAHMQTPSTFINAGWDFSSATPTWGLLTTAATTSQGQSYPYLNAVQQGIIIPTDSTSAAENIAVVSNGAVVNPVQSTGVLNGTTTYYVLLNRLGLSTSSPILIYNTNGSYNFNALVALGTGAASNAITLPQITNNSVAVGGAANSFSTGTNYNSSLANTSLGIAAGNLGNSSGILYSVSGGDLILNNGVSLYTTAGTNYTIDGAITASGAGALNFSGPITINNNGLNIAANTQTYSDAITLLSAASFSGANLTFGAIDGAQALTFAATNNLLLSGAIGGSVAPTSLTDNSTGNSTLSANVTTSGAQIYNNALTIGVSSVTMTGGSFTISNLISGLGNTLNLVGSGGASSLIFAAGNNIWTIASSNSGSVSSSLLSLAGFNFSSFTNLTGGTGSDSFVFNNGVNFNGSIDGGLGSNSLDYSAYSNANAITANITDSNIGNVIVGGNTAAFSNISSITGGAGANIFNIGVSGSIDNLVGGGSGSLNSQNMSASTWNITGSNSGNIVGVVSNFSGMSHLSNQSSSGQDFVFADNVNFNGAISGNNKDSFDYSAYTSDIAANITGFNSGSVVANGITTTFTGIGSISGGAGNDTMTIGASGQMGGFIGNGGSNSVISNRGTLWNITDSNSGLIDGILFNFENITSITNNVAASTFIFDDGVNFNGVITGSGSDVLDYTRYNTNGISAVITGANSGNVASAGTLNFTGVNSILGGAGDDNFTVNAGGSIDTLDGNAGNNTLTSVAGSIWNITGGNAGNIVGVVTNVFNNINNLINNNSGNNSFVFADGVNFNGNITGNGSDRLDYSAYTSPNAISANITGNQSGIVGTNNFSGINAIIGGAGNDAFSIAASGVIGTLTGNAGTNSLTSANGSTWNITGTNAGNIASVAAFSGINNLTNTGAASSFVFADGINFNGNIVGNGSDTLDYSAYTSGNAINANVTGNKFGIIGSNSFSGINAIVTGAGNDSFAFGESGVIGSLNGGAGNNSLTSLNGSAWNLTSNNSGNITGVINNFSNINNITANGGTYTLTGPSGNHTWTIIGNNSGNLDSSLQFSGFANLVGGGDNDTYILSNGTLSGSLDGGLGSNTLQADGNVANTWNLTGSNIGTVNGIANGFSAIQNLVAVGSLANTFVMNTGASITSIIGNAVNNTLTMLNTATNDFTITGADSGVVQGTVLSFSNISNLNGGSGANQFTFNDGSSISGSLNGGSDPTLNSITFNYATPVRVNLATIDYAGTALNNASSPITAFTNIGGVYNVATLATSSIPSAISISAGGVGIVNDPVAFSGVTTIIGNSSTTVNFGVQTILDSATGVANVNGFMMQFTNIPTENFSGNLVVNFPATPSTPTQPSTVQINSINSAIGQISLQTFAPATTTTTTTSTSSSSSSSSSSSDSSTASASPELTTPAVTTVTQSVDVLLQTQANTDTAIRSEQQVTTGGTCGI